MKFENVSDYFTRINMLFHCIVGIPLVLFIFLYLELDRGSLRSLFEGKLVNNIFLFLSVTVSVTLTWYSFKSYKTCLAIARKELSLKEKLETLHKGTLYHYTLLGIVSLLILLGLFVTAMKLFGLLYIFVLMILSFRRPTLERITIDLRLKGEERSIVLDKKAL